MSRCLFVLPLDVMLIAPAVGDGSGTGKGIPGLLLVFIFCFPKPNALLPTVLILPAGDLPSPS